MTNMNSVRLKAKELLRFYSGCHGDLVNTTAMYVLSRKLLIKYDNNKNKNEGVIDILLWLPWKLGYRSNNVCD